MLAVIYARLLHGFHHVGGLRHGGTAGLHVLGVLLMIVATVVGAATATAAVSSWVAKRYKTEDSIKVAGWVTFVVVFAALGWLTLRIA